jgi:acyl carrier protein
MLCQSRDSNARNNAAAIRRAGAIIAKMLEKEGFSKQTPRSTMPEDNLRDAIKEMMVENLMLKVTKEEIADDLPLFGPGGLGLDSIDALELVVSLEKKFGVSVPNSETARQALATVDSIHDYVLAHKVK